jgi:acyl-CoA synthetase (NDP forming)
MATADRALERSPAASDARDAPRPPVDLRPLFAPRSIAVVGASLRGGIAETVRANLEVLGSPTRCHFVNPRYQELHGQPCFPSIAALPEVPDVVLVAVNPLRAASVVAEAAAAGVPAAIIPGGGVVEGGEAAARMQAEVREIAVRHGIALLGPNCMGLVDLTTNSRGAASPGSPSRAR